MTEAQWEELRCILLAIAEGVRAQAEATLGYDEDARGSIRNSAEAVQSAIRIHARVEREAMA